MLQHSLNFSHKRERDTHTPAKPLLGRVRQCEQRLHGLLWRRSLCVDYAWALNQNESKDKPSNAEQRMRSASKVGNIACAKAKRTRLSAWSSLMDACSWAAAVTPESHIKPLASKKRFVFLFKAPSSSRTAAPSALAPHRGAADLVSKGQRDLLHKPSRSP